MGDFPLNVDPRPLNGYVLVRMVGSTEITSGGLYLPKSAHERPIQGKVEEVSPGWYEGMMYRSHQVAIGDVVIFNWKAGFDLRLDDGDETIDFRIVHERDIIAILRGVNYG